LVLAPSEALAEMTRGVIAYEGRGCSVYAISTPTGYTIAEWYGGLAYQGDMVVGELNSYGFQTLYNTTRDGKLRVWIDDFWLSRDRAIEKLLEKRCR
jgi:hypothetical protein